MFRYSIIAFQHAFFAALVFINFIAIAPSASAFDGEEVQRIIGEQLASTPDDDDDDDEGRKTKLKVREKRKLKFDKTASSIDGPGTITLSPTGSVNATGDVVVMGYRFQTAKFVVTGPKNTNVTITLPTSVTVSNGQTTTTLHNFQSVPSGVANLGNNGKLTIKVGATLNIPAGLNRGRYRGPFRIYVDLL
jgi:hypothetical protein